MRKFKGPGVNHKQLNFETLDAVAGWLFRRHFARGGLLRPTFRTG